MIEDGLDDDDLENQEEVFEPVVREGLIIVSEDNIVSEEEDFVENEDDELSDEETRANIEVENEEVVVADVEDNPEPSQNTSTRPRRANAGAGVERLQMGFKGKGYGARREFNLVMNKGEEKGNLSKFSHASSMQIACGVIFAQTATSGNPKK